MKMCYLFMAMIVWQRSQLLWKDYFIKYWTKYNFLLVIKRDFLGKIQHRDCGLEKIHIIISDGPFLLHLLSL